MVDIDQIPYESQLVSAVDALVKVAKPCGKTVTKEYDWKVIEKIIKMWQVLYPEESEYFNKSMQTWRSHTKKSGIAKGKGGAMIQHKLEMPQKLHGLIMAIFPDQKWDKKFVNKFAKRFKLFAGNKI